MWPRRGLAGSIMIVATEGWDCPGHPPAPNHRPMKRRCTTLRSSSAAAGTPSPWLAPGSRPKAASRPTVGPDGVYARFGEPTFDGWDLFREDPRAWWEAALEQRARGSAFSAAIDRATPNAGHYALAGLEQMGRLAHIITQNIDNLHQLAGSRRITEIHGNRFKVAVHGMRGARAAGKGPHRTACPRSAPPAAVSTRTTP